MNARGHMLVGAVAGAGLAVVMDLIQDNEISIKNIAIGAGVGACAGLLPDILEPATSPHHRQTLHSIATAAALIYAAKCAHENRELPPAIKGILISGIGGYVSHLVADGLTPMGLPLL